MSVKTACSSRAEPRPDLPVIAYLEDDLAARAALDGMRKFNLVPWDAQTHRLESTRVLVAASEQALCAHWETLRCSDLRIIALSDSCYRNSQLHAAIFAYLPSATPAHFVERMIEVALQDIRVANLNHELTERLRATSAEVDELNRIGVALSAEHDIAKLLEIILTKARQITNADAGSIYLVEGADEQPPCDATALPRLNAESGAAPKPLTLRFAWAQNDSLILPFRELALEVSETSIAGHVALTGEYVHLEDAYNLPPELPYTINRSFDVKLGYRTKSILAVPMCDDKNKVVGVLQLMNCKRDAFAKLTSLSAVAAQVLPFSTHHRELIMSMASQAAIALQNSRLLTSIENLFEGFVQASVVAIEQRDPTTCGHSFRVAEMALALAEAVNQSSTGPLAPVQFTPNQLKELRYAALLHDFGKVGVREHVLLKATKLYPAQLELLRHRFLFAKLTAETELLRSKLEFLLSNGELAYRETEQQAKSNLQQYWAELDTLWDAVQRSNLPTVTPECIFTSLAKAASHTYSSLDGTPHPLVTEDEVHLLSIPQGSLDQEERAQMEAHVTYTVRFLSQIPWTTELHGVPAIAAGHHEKLNGSGYPRHLTAQEIPIQTRIITIVDIFDGLTAADRPYKKAVSPEGALGILHTEMNAGAIDPDLFELFASLVQQGAHTVSQEQRRSVSSDKSAVA